MFFLLSYGADLVLLSSIVIVLRPDLVSPFWVGLNKNFETKNLHPVPCCLVANSDIFTYVIHNCMYK